MSGRRGRIRVERRVVGGLWRRGGPPNRAGWEDNSHKNIVYIGLDAFVERFEHAPKRRHKAPR